MRYHAFMRQASWQWLASLVTEIGVRSMYRSRMDGKVDKTVGRAVDSATRCVVINPQTAGGLRIMRVGDVNLLLDSHRIVVRGTLVHLPSKEFLILRQLMDNAGRVVIRRENELLILTQRRWPGCSSGLPSYLEYYPLEIVTLRDASCGTLAPLIR